MTVLFDILEMIGAAVWLAMMLLMTAGPVVILVAVLLFAFDLVRFA